MNQNIKIPKLLKIETDEATGRLTARSAALIFSLFGWVVFTMSFAVDAASWVLLFVRSLVHYLTEYFSFFGYIDAIFEHFMFNDLFGVFAIYCISLPLALPFLLMMPRQKIARSKMTFGKFLIGFCICMGLMSVGSYISQAFFSIFQTFMPIGENPVLVATQSSPWWFNFLTVVIIAPIFEELVFRKLLCDRLSVLGEGFAIMLSSLFFGLFHGNFYQVFYAFMIGAFLGFIYVKTGKIRYTIFYHMMVNFIGGILTPALAGLMGTGEIPLDDPMKMLAAVLPVALFYLFEGAILTIGAFGITMLIVKRRQIFLSLKSGPLAPPVRWELPLVFNSGIIAAIIMVVIRMTVSLIM